MKPEDLKNGIDSIKADDYLKTRLFAKITETENPKKKNRKVFKALVSSALCCAVLVTGLGIGIPKLNNSSESLTSADVDYSGNYFVMSVFAAENDKKTSTPIDDHTVVLPNYKINKEYDENSNFDGAAVYGENGFSIKGENIKSVKYTCQTGTFDAYDGGLKEYMIENNEYYDAVVPYSVEYEHHSVNERLDIMYKHIENGDYDKYIKNENIKSYEEYAGVDFIYDDSEGAEDNKIAVGLVSNESFDKWFNLHIKEYEFQNYYDWSEDFANIDWTPDLDYVMGNPENPLSDIPHDTISVEVTFNDGSVQYASYDFSFNDNGELVIDRIAEN